jgi:beta-galactosidase
LTLAPDLMKPPHLLLGVCDYPEHVPPDRWPIYARQQRELGLKVVRLAEFAWAWTEPQPGVYRWDWLDEAVAALHAEGLGVILCTPTATPPAWLIHAHPEILPVDAQGRVRAFGSRRHYDFASPVYREHSRRITRELAARYGEHPAVIGWQTDNEYGCHATARSYGPASVAAFREWLRGRYGTLDALNEAWGNVFWSMEYTAWEQIGAPHLTVTETNPSHELDYSRCASDTIRDFNREQVEILRELSPGRPVTHNFMIFEGSFDHYRVAADLDFVTWDSYPTGMLEFFWPGDDALKTRYARTGHPDLIAFNHDLYRGLLRRPFGVMEQQCGQVNWAPWNPLPAPGAVALWTAQAWAHGADLVSYFRWRAATMSQEVMHSGLLRHDETPDRGYAEVAALDPALFPNGDVPAKVALLHDYESLWAWEAQPHAADFSCWEQVVTYYSALRSLGVDVDVISADAELDGYDLIVAPALTLMTAERAAALTDAATRARVVFGPRTAYRTETGRTPEDGQFGALSGLIGARLLQFDSLRPTLSHTVSGGFTARKWAETYRLQGAEATHRYGGGVLDGLPAVIRQGQVTVIGAHSPELVAEILERELTAAGVPLLPCPEGVRVSRRAGTRLVQNWTDQPVVWEGRELAPVSFQLVEE